jgi:hypothetical protein
MQEFLWKTYLESVAQPNVPIEQAVAQQAVAQQAVAQQAVAQQAVAQQAVAQQAVAQQAVVQRPARMSTSAGIYHFTAFAILKQHIFNLYYKLTLFLNADIYT